MSEDNLSECPYRGRIPGETIPGTKIRRCWPCDSEERDYRECDVFYGIGYLIDNMRGQDIRLIDPKTGTASRMSLYT